MIHPPILVVEDEPDGQELVVRILGMSQLATEVAGTAEDAWTMLNAKPYEAVIIDLALPEQDGLALCGQIRAVESLKTLPLVAITAFHTPELKQRAMFEGFDAYFVKPLDRARFLAEVERLLSGE